MPHHVTILLSWPEAEGLRLESEAAGTTVSEIIRASLLGSPLSVATPCREDREALKAVNEIGPLVIKLDTLAVNAGTATDCRLAIAEIANALFAIREALIVERDILTTPTGALPTGRTETIRSVLVDDAEHRVIADAAASLGLSVTKWARAVLVAMPIRVTALKPLTTDADRDSLRTFSRILGRCTAVSVTPWHEVRQAVPIIVGVRDRLAPEAVAASADSQEGRVS